MIEAFEDEFRFLEANVNIAFTLLIHNNDKVTQQNNI